MIKKFFKLWKEDSGQRKVNKTVLFILIILGACTYLYINSKTGVNLEIFGFFHISIVDILLLIVAVSFYIYAKRRIETKKNDGKKSQKVGKDE